MLFDKLAAENVAAMEKLAASFISPFGLVTNLMEHQKIGVTWMLQQEKAETDLPALWERRTEGGHTGFFFRLFSA